MNVIQIKDTPIDAADLLSDEQLDQGGMEVVHEKLWKRKTASKEALRKQKQRKNQQAEGMCDLSIVVPETARESLKTIAAKLVSGESLEEAIKSVTCHAHVTGMRSFSLECQEKAFAVGMCILSATGWKKIILKLIKVI